MAEREEATPAVWDPFRELAPWSLLRSRNAPLSRALDELFERSAGLRQLAPPVDITETDDAYVVSVEVPGVKKEDIAVEIQEGVLSIRGEKRSEREEKKEKGRYLERTYGAFSRSFTVPADAHTEQIDASFRDGVLEVKLSKKPEAKPKVIAIKS